MIVIKSIDLFVEQYPVSSGLLELVVDNTLLTSQATQTTRVD